MAISEKSKMWVDRVVGFLVGGLLILLIVNVGFVGPLKSQKLALETQLNEIHSGAQRLLDEAKAFAESKNYDSALKTLDTLFIQQPISAEAAEGKKLYATIEATVKKNNQKWEAAVGGLKAAWEKTRSSELRAELEKGMAETLSKEWENSKDTIRKDWEAQHI